VKYLSLTILSMSLLVACKSTEPAKVVEETTNEITLEEFCKSNECRKNKHVKFKTDNGVIDQVLPLYWPVAQKNKISILPGDKLFIEAEVINGNSLGNFKLVDEIKNPDKTIQFSFTQMDSSVGMMLSVKNPFSFNIKYHLNMIDFSGNPHKTSSCPVRAKISVFESWPHPIPELILTDMHFLQESDVMTCIY